RQKAREQIKYLIGQVREIIRSEAKIDDIERSQLDELTHLFADSGGNNDVAKQGDDEDPERFRYGDARKGKREQPDGINGHGAGKRRFGEEARKAKKSIGPGIDSGRRTGAQPAVPLQAIRSMIPDPLDARGRTLFFTPGSDGEIELEVAASGLSGDIRLIVSSASSGRAANGRIRKSVVAGERVSVGVTFAEPFSGPIELTASAVKPTV
ncbi:MAG: putative calcium binding hemolysin, partial [Herminiimonas sp.]|nr:putative calcium binding hemolysin [Herminiimonas sp.]